MATQYTCSPCWCLPPSLTSTVKSSLFTHVHSSPLSLAARLHRCCTNCSCYINNGWTFFRQTSYSKFSPPVFISCLLSYLLICPAPFSLVFDTSQISLVPEYAFILIFPWHVHAPAPQVITRALPTPTNTTCLNFCYWFRGLSISGFCSGLWPVTALHLKGMRMLFTGSSACSYIRNSECLCRFLLLCKNQIIEVMLG